MILLFIVLVFICFEVQKATKTPDPNYFTTNVELSTNVVEINEELTAKLTVKNRTILVFPFIRVKLNVSRDLISEGPLEFSTWLMPFQKITVDFKLKSPKRGRFASRYITFQAGDFLGMDEFIFDKEGYAEFVCLPARSDEDISKKINGGILGDLSVNRFIFDDPISHIGYRDYTGREAMKQISWTRTAQSGKLMVKQPDFTMENTAQVILDIDSPDEDTIEKNYSLCRSLLELLDAKGIKYSLSTNAILTGLVGTYYFPEGHGTLHLQDLLVALGRGSLEARQSKKRLVQDSLAHNTTSSNNILVSGGEICSL